MKEYYNLPLKHLHTFGIEQYSKRLIEIENEIEINELINSGVFNDDFFVLGGGSNVLFLNIPTVIVRICTKGIEKINENNEFVWIKAKAGEIWDSFVEFCVNNNWGGLENMSLIPGTVGASPIQNIGAHGAEIKDSLYELKAINLKTKQIKIFNNNECEFSYRDSIFKKNKTEKWLITEVVFKLTKKNHFYNLSYGNLKEYFANKEVSLKAIREYVIYQRNAKLPNPNDLGNAGSFFKNPIVDKQTLNKLQKFDKQVPFFVVDNHFYKIPAAWLIEKAGLKGYRKGNVGTYHKQPLVIVNYGGAVAQEIYLFSEFIVNEVFNKFGIKLEREVNIIQ
jgi:UDP-N-acetylmuramate dehydrogenase